MKRQNLEKLFGLSKMFEPSWSLLVLAVAGSEVAKSALHLVDLQAPISRLQVHIPL